ncbi:MAG: hypothetical protein UT76_C0012G0003 [Candidatus Woesebacteria bacterium GW2011_GWB1_40_12]|uniref:Uncharacterized protein n=1 Tax=Candidatus Woesebacteria bacterium GW2011_GWB1_40_12 TaxID=1618576 RepID=A0A0G0QSW0_9BACT|nr:MAG: hypothetical protein UT76_C0012G0003 [Candidatus Woesebacteria bacterium GW2011_GWB1_40_12]
MQERINIWGKQGCELPSGKLCNACCVLPNIELDGQLVSITKPENSPCPHLNDSSGKKGEGCGLHQKGKPGTCESWHCSSLRTSDKVNYIAQELSLGLVSETEALAVASESIRSLLIDTAKRISKITTGRELIVRDLDEP